MKITNKNINVTQNTSTVKYSQHWQTTQKRKTYDTRLTFFILDFGIFFVSHSFYFKERIIHFWNESKLNNIHILKLLYIRYLKISIQNKYTLVSYICKILHEQRMLTIWYCSIRSMDHKSISTLRYTHKFTFMWKCSFLNLQLYSHCCLNCLEYNLSNISVRLPNSFNNHSYFNVIILNNIIQYSLDNI